MQKAAEIKNPGLGRLLWEKWKRFGKKIGDFQARALLTFFYYVLLSPFALALRRWGDPLAIKLDAAKGWRPRTEDPDTAEKRASRQF
jgi:hypothetical protein